MSHTRRLLIMKTSIFALSLAYLLCLRCEPAKATSGEKTGHKPGTKTKGNSAFRPHDGKGEKMHKTNGDEVKSVKGTLQKVRQRERAEAMQKVWQDTFKEIKSLVVDFQPPHPNNKNEGKALFSRWKLLLDGGNADGNGEGERAFSGEAKADCEAAQTRHRMNRQRFDGFASWERRLQQWADDAAEYLNQTQTQILGGGDNRLTMFSRPATSEKMTEKDFEAADEKIAILVPSNAVEGTEQILMKSHGATNEDASEKKRDMISLSTASKRFVPRPARPDEAVAPHTDISDKTKNIWIVTTASLPWMTGTAVNPLLRAAYLTNGRAEVGGSVTLMLPWLERPEDQQRIYGKDKIFESKGAQEEFVRGWLKNTANMTEASKELNIAWYTAWQETAENSVYSMGDITALIPDETADICVLEEPEHLNWYRAPGESWTKKFDHVVGIVHTNYFVYAQEQPGALIRAPAMKLLCSWMCRAHCHRVIKLSGTLSNFAPEKELVENVHGVRRTFLDYGEELCDVLQSPESKTHPVFGPEASPTVYFIGKMLWSKGIGSLMELVKYAEESADLKIKVDMYGGGPNKDDAEAKSKKLGLDMPFHGPVDHALLASTHKIFVNPSTSEVLCTTIAEALAMGKFVIVPSHPSHDFFAQFPNCLPYASKEEFVGNMYYALTHSPSPLTEEYSYALSWQAATERFEAAGCVSVEEAEAMSHAVATAEDGIEIDLPPLIESEKHRKQITTTLSKSRERYRQFRERLSQEIQQSNVLPTNLQRRLINDLDKRLDLDLDQLLESPKLKIALSPAELDMQLLDFYNKVSEGPGGDVLRVIGGGLNVGRQNLYLKQQAMKKKRQLRQDEGRRTPHESPWMTDVLQDVGIDVGGPTVSNWVKRTLRHNMPPRTQNFGLATKLKASPRSEVPNPKKEDTLQMAIGSHAYSRGRRIEGRHSLHCIPRTSSGMQPSLRSNFKIPTPLI